MNNKSLALPTVRLVLGVFAILLSLLFSIQFVAQGNSGGAIISAVIFCVVTEFCKVAFCGDFAYYWETNQGSKALFSGVIVALLFALSISSAVYVLTISPAKNEAIVTQSDSHAAILQKQVADKQAQIAGCNPNYISKCIKPLNDQLTSLQSELNGFLKQGDTLTEAKANQQFWSKLAAYVGTDPNSLQVNFAIARAVILDLLGLILISQYTATQRINSKNHFYVSYPPPPVQQQQGLQSNNALRNVQHTQPPPKPINYKINTSDKWAKW